LRCTTILGIAYRSCAMALALGMVSPGGADAQTAITGVPNAMQGFSQNRDQPVRIEAETLEIRDKQKLATFSGHVRVVQGDATMTAARSGIDLAARAPQINRNRIN
jgi:lipopolysaccharide export system protein LptA